MEFGVDDLFEDSAPKTSHSRIDERLDELRRGGCQQRIAWSKLGCIAIINSSGTEVETRHLACNPVDGRWLLSPAYPVAGVRETHKGQRIQHVTWSSHGADLAVVDVLGRISFYTVYVAINALAPVASIPASDYDDDLNALVGFWWLPRDSHYSLHSMVRAEDGVKYSCPSFRTFGPFHPVLNKAAALGVTRNGIVKLWYHDGINKFLSTSCELESVTSLDDVFTHASITSTCTKEGTAVIAAYTHSRQLRIYKVAIDWHQPPQTQPTPNPKSQAHLHGSPTLVTKRIRIVDSAFPPDSPEDSVRTQLTHLEILGPVPSAGSTGMQAPTPTVLGVFAGKTAERQPYSVVLRWDLKDASSALHPSFDQLGARRASASSQTTSELDLHKLPDTVLDKCVVNVSAVIMGTVVAFSCSDGTFEFRDRFQLQPFENKTLDSQITNMIQAGFVFPPGEPCVDMVLSPNNTVAVRQGQDNELQMIVMEFGGGGMDVKENMEITCVSLALQHAYSCSNYLNNDDLLIVARKYRSQEFNNTFLTEVHRAVALKMDFAVSESPSERLVRNPLLQRCLSLQFALDYQGERVRKQLPGKLAWATLHLRVASLAFALTWNSTQQTANRTGPVDFRPEALQTLLGLTRWYMDMLSFIIGDLFDLAKACRGRTDDLDFIRTKMLESNSPALFLALSSAPRAFLRYNCRSLKGLEAVTGKQLQSGFDEDSRTTFRSFKVPIETCAVKMLQFEKLMTDIDGSIRAAYANVSEAERAEAERRLFVNNELPAVFVGPVDRLLSVTLPKLREEMDVARLFFHDVAWLGLHDDAATAAFNDRTRIDAVRKVVLAKNGLRLRRCTRCCSIVDDGAMTRNGSNWVASFNRMCLCGTLWMYLVEGKGAKDPAPGGA